MLANSITVFRTALCLPLFAVLAFGPAEIAILGVGLFLFSGLLDMIDGPVARARGEASAFGGAVDLIGDRLLTLTAATGLILGGAIPVAASIALIILIARDAIVASLAEVTGKNARLNIRGLEAFKIASAFLGMILLMTRQPNLEMAGTAVLAVAALLSVITVGIYLSRAASILAESNSPASGSPAGLP